MAPLFDQDHLDFIRLLNKHEVEYILIGGIAVNIYGYNRGTGDVDIWIGSSVSTKENLIAAIEEFGYDTSQYRETDPAEILIFSLGSRDQPGHIEIMNRIAGVNFEEAYQRVETKIIESIPMKVIHLNDLIANKKAAARPRDLDDIDNLSNLKKEE